MGHPQLATDTSRVQALDRHGGDPARSGAEGAGSTVHRAARPCRDHRGPRVRTARAHGETAGRRERGQPRRTAVGARTDGRGPHRIHGNGPHAQPTRLGGRGRRAHRRLRTQQRHARLAALRPRTLRRRPGVRRSPARRPRRVRPLRGRPHRVAGDRRRWSTPSRCSAPGTPPAAADSSARPWWASSTKWAACSPTATPTSCSGACGASPPTSPSSRAGCPTTSASNPPPRSTSSSPPTRPARAATGPRAGEALSRAARQMVHLGRPDDALDLMKLARSGSGEEVLPRTRAMLCTIEAWAQASMGTRPGHAPHPRRGGGALRLRQGGRAAAELDADVRRGGPARNGGPGLPHPRRPRARRGGHRTAPRQGALELRATAGSGRRSSTTSRWPPPASSRDDPEQADRYARLALVSMGRDLLAPHLGPAARDVPAHRSVRRATRRSRTCARRSSCRCRRAVKARGGSSAGHRGPVPRYAPARESTDRGPPRRRARP